MEVIGEVKGLVEEEVFREYLRERVRIKDAVQVVLVGPEGTIEAPANNEGNVVEGGVVGGIVRGVIGGSVTVSGAKPAPEN